MRWVWLVIVILIVSYMVIDTSLSIAGGRVQSAAQASQLYDAANMTLLAVIAVTLAIQLVASDYHKSQPASAAPADDENPHPKFIAWTPANQLETSRPPATGDRAA